VVTGRRGDGLRLDVLAPLQVEGVGRPRVGIRKPGGSALKSWGTGPDESLGLRAGAAPAEVSGVPSGGWRGPVGRPPWRSPAWAAGRVGRGLLERLTVGLRIRARRASE